MLRGSRKAYNRKCPACLGKATSVLGQPDFTTTTENITATRNGLRLPTAVASDGVHVVVADTNHNRVMKAPAGGGIPRAVIHGLNRPFGVAVYGG